MIEDRSKMSAMMRQYLATKDDYPDAILMYRVGDFYEMFFDDAVTASRELELVLTGKDCGLPERAPMCGVPFHAVDNYISRLVAKGYKVAICEQVEDPKEAKGLVKRDVIRVVTPGTTTDSSLLDSRPTNYMCAVKKSGNDSALAIADVSTGEVLVTKITSDDENDLISEINIRIEKGQRTLVTTLTKKMAEDLTEYLGAAGIKCRYMHHDIGAIERMEIIRSLRLGDFDVLVGINLLREGLDLPEVSLVAILDADKEGFLRSETSLIQTIGRAARNAEGTVIMYADTVTRSMRLAIDETERRRAKQAAYNAEHGIVPKTIVKSVRELIEISSESEKTLRRADGVKLTKSERKELIEKLEKEMKAAAKMLEFELAAQLRDEIVRLRGEVK